MRAVTLYTYVDAETGQETDPRTYSIMELNREHRDLYVLRTSQGAIVLRHMPLRMRRIIDDARNHIYPRTAELLAEVEELRPFFDGIDEADWKPEAKERLERIYQELRTTDMDALGVIVSPDVATMDDVNEIYERLTEIERQKLALIIKALATPTPPEDIDSTALEIAKANGLEIIDREMLENLTVSQAAYYMGRIRKENEQIRRMMRPNERVVQ